MINAANIGQRARVRAADHFYAFIDGWTGAIDGFLDNGLAVLKVAAQENGQDVDKLFYLPPDQLELITCPLASHSEQSTAYAVAKKSR